MDYDKIMAKAKKTNAKRDKDERDSGFAAPMDNGPFQYLRTAAAAIESGIKTDDWDSVAEGLVMIEDILARYVPIRRVV